MKTNISVCFTFAILVAGRFIIAWIKFMSIECCNEREPSRDLAGTIYFFARNLDLMFCRNDYPADKSTISDMFVYTCLKYNIPWVRVTKLISSVLVISSCSNIAKTRFHIRQVSPQLSCGDSSKIWMWFKESNPYICKIENFAYGEIQERGFSNPTPVLCYPGYRFGHKWGVNPSVPSQAGGSAADTSHRCVINCYTLLIEQFHLCHCWRCIR